MEPITSFLKTGKLARKQSYRNLTIFPLLGPNGGTRPNYLTLEQALDDNLIQITEKDQGADVPELKLVNTGKKPMLIIEGEELVGAKQNRIVNATFLVAGKTEVVLPVSCVEQGRWNYESDEFASGNRMMHPSLRREHQHDVKFSLSRGEGYRSDQGRIWEDIAEKSIRMKVDAPTEAMSAVFESYEDRLSEFLRAFRPMELQVGAVFAINGEILGLECFGCADTFGRFFEKLVKSYALDALDSPVKNGKKSVPPNTAKRFVEAALKCKYQSHPSLGLGKNVTFDARTVSGAALIEKKRVLHLSAFKKSAGARGSGVQYMRYSQRRDRRLH
ncbi:MAG: DUF6569 family protein [Thermodesulfobacteriota bacterium]|nr:DUF6569 family protein [Thermodesulfobacteriota bacterium]